MTKREFQRLIHEAEVELSETHEDIYHSGVCEALRDANNYLTERRTSLKYIPTVRLFEEITRPINSSFTYWFRSTYNEKSRHVRMIALRLFEQYVISEKLYLKL